MGSIGSWYVRSVPADPEEEVTAGYSANYLRNDGRPLGGKLYLTSDRIVFTPHLIDAWFGGDGFECRLSEIVTVDKTPPSSGEGKKRLVITDTAGKETQFVVHSLDDAHEQVDTAVADRLG